MSLCGVVVASCVGASDPTTDDAALTQAGSTEPTGEAQQATGPDYQSKDFQFAVVKPDDRKDGGGGWQEAEHIFPFEERALGLFVTYSWTCHIRIGMPIQTVHEGYITKYRAALYSAEIANDVVDELLATRPTWKNQGAAFCIQLRMWMQDEFRKQYPNLGAIINQ
jgi:hypothetical protein